MKKRIAINGFGRIGRLFFRQIAGNSKIEVVAINDLGDATNLAYLLRHDSVYRNWPEEIKIEGSSSTNLGTKGNFLIVNGKKIVMLQEKEAAKLPWKDLKIDLVVESTGAFDSFEKAEAHLKAGAKKVVITAPAKDEEGTAGGRTVLMGVNDEKLKTCRLSSNGSCTTNATAPVVAVLAEKLGIKKAVLNTIHAYTATQLITDGPVRGKDFLRGRAGAQNIIPSTTGAAIATTRVVPELAGKFDGVAMRVPVVAGSAADITFLASRKTTVEEVNSILKKAAREKRWKGILNVSEEPLTSSDIIREPYAAIVDASFTKVVDGDLVKVLSWYDNEWGYVATLIRHVEQALK